MSWLLVGVDPAPGKKSTVWTASGCSHFPPADVGAALERETRSDAVLLAWDAPLSFDAAFGFCDRPIDWAIRRFIKKQPVEAKAVAALPFAGCPHWAITCSVLGTPFPSSSTGWALGPAALPSSPGRFAFEVNPSVAWAFWWIQAGISEPMPRYKGTDSKRGRDAMIASLSALNIPPEATKNDDTLDAWAAWRLLADLVVGAAEVVGLPAEGAYLLPKVAAAQTPLAALLAEGREELRKKTLKGN